MDYDLTSMGLTCRATERDRGKIDQGAQGSRGLIAPNASRSEGPHKLN